jgi:hypothetical protein
MPPPTIANGINPAKTRVISPPFTITRLFGIKKAAIAAKLAEITPLVLLSLKSFLKTQCATAREDDEEEKFHKVDLEILVFQDGNVHQPGEGSDNPVERRKLRMVFTRKDAGE